MKIGHFDLVAKDANASRDFYESVLWLEVVDVQTEIQMGCRHREMFDIH